MAEPDAAPPDADLRTLDVLRAVVRCQEQLIVDAAPERAIADALDELVTLTASRSGFVGHVDARIGAQHLRTVAGEARGFADLDALVGEVLRTRQPVLGGVAPDGHVVGLPLHASGDCVGVVGLANRPGGYSRQLLRDLQPLLGACATLLAAYRGAERRRAVDATAGSSEALLRAIIDHTPALVHVKDRDGRYTLANRRFGEVFGVDPEDVVGRRDEDFLPAELAARARLNDLRVLGGGAPIETAELFPHADGIERHYVSQRFALRDALDRCYAVCAISTDVTERRRLERELQRSRKLEALGQLAGGVAHDFNNLLTAILGSAELLAGRVRDDAQALDHVQQIEAAGTRAGTLVSQMLAFSRGHLTEPVPVALDELLAGLEPLLARLVGHRVQLDIDVDPDVPRVLADPAQLEQVVLNLAVNARDAMPDGGGLEIRVTSTVVAEDGADVGALPAGRYAVLVVRDGGVGMPPEVAERAVDPFFSTKPADQGTGIGLSTTLGIVRKAGGDLLIDSREGAGTTVRVLLPAGADESAAGPAGVQTPGARRGERETVLVVEDQAAVRSLLCHVLAGHGYDVVEAAGGPDALRTVASLDRPVDLLLSDVALPGTSGPELAARLASANPRLRVVYMSGYAKEHALAGEPAAGFLQKPFGAAALLAAVRDAVDGGAARAGAGR